MHYFYAEKIQDNQAFLSDEETRHLIKSLRAKDGDQIWLLDGRGRKYRARLYLRGSEATLTIEESLSYEKKAHRLHLAIAPTKMPSRTEWMVEKATELGIDTITPIITARSEKTRIKIDRLQKIALSALKQSGQPYLPMINQLTTFDAFVQTRHADLKMIAHCQTEDLPHLSKMMTEAAVTTILIGPEGDFTMAEVDQARAQGFAEVSLGKSRLRTETAGIFVTTLHTMLNREY